MIDGNAQPKPQHRLPVNGWVAGALLTLLPACSSAIPHHAQQAEQKRKAEEHVAAQEQSVEEWKQSRSQILRTFAFRALEKNLTEESQSYLQQACDLDPTDVESHATLARLFLTEDDPEASLAYAQQGMESTPGNLDLSLVTPPHWLKTTSGIALPPKWSALQTGKPSPRAQNWLAPCCCITPHPVPWKRRANL